MILENFWFQKDTMTFWPDSALSPKTFTGASEFVLNHAYFTSHVVRTGVRSYLVKLRSIIDSKITFDNT